jgi:hypothetical protein
VFASLDDVNMHLPTDKLEITDPDLALFGLDADRIIRGYLAGVFLPATIASWNTPANTPELIRAIAGRFIAAFYYRERYSEDSLDDPVYAQNKYNEAMALLTGVINGTMTLVEVTEAPMGAQLTSDDFYPNDTATGPFFTMDDQLFNIPPFGTSAVRRG